MIGSFLSAITKQTSRLTINSNQIVSKQMSTLTGKILEQGLSSLSINSTGVGSNLLNPGRLSHPINVVQNRFNWGYKGRMMLKDIKRRELLKKYAPVRIRLQTLRANSVLPKIIKVFKFLFIKFR